MIRVEQHQNRGEGGPTVSHTPVKCRLVDQHEVAGNAVNDIATGRYED